MRCYCCNNILTPYESTMRNVVTREFLDVCLKCLKTIDIPAIGNPKLHDENEAGTEIADYIEN